MYGWWGARQIHFAEEWNELHHLQIMESLGGDQYWVDRFLAQHAAVFYYWTVVLFFAVSPSQAYTFSELVEARLWCRVSGTGPLHVAYVSGRLGFPSETLWQTVCFVHDVHRLPAVCNSR